MDALPSPLLQAVGETSHTHKTSTSPSFNTHLHRNSHNSTVGISNFLQIGAVADLGHKVLDEMTVSNKNPAISMELGKTKANTNPSITVCLALY